MLLSLKLATLQIPNTVRIVAANCNTRKICIGDKQLGWPISNSLDRGQREEEDRTYNISVIYIVIIQVRRYNKIIKRFVCWYTILHSYTI